MRAAVRPAAAIDEAVPSMLLIASQPLVPHATAGPIARAQLAQGEAVALRVANEAKAFFHGNTLLPGHHHLAHWRLVMQVSRSVTDVPGLRCYLCTRITPPQ